MYLKRIEISGFKSFANRTELDFTTGVTAVVGPNGSGKSNLSDAVRWVLGEQSAKSLRGAKIEDVIFAGSTSEHRKQIAEVTLVLDNEDGMLPLPYQEVNVTRRVNRNGDSDYFLNRKACRLKDILDLFIDTGLSRDAFAIIGQGRVEQVISGKAEERRSVIEEAAGVLKYRQRKKQAERKLGDTESNLSRVDDILYELGGRIEPLREQASLAKEYLIARERHDFLEQGVIAEEIRTYQQQVEALLEEITACEERLAEERKAVALKQEEREAKEVALDASRQEEKSLQERLRLVATTLVEIKGALNLAKEREKHGTETKERLEREVALAESRVETAEADKREAQVRLHEADTAYQAAHAQRKASDEALNFSNRDFEQEAETVRSEAFEVASELAAKTNAHNRAKADLNHAIEQQQAFESSAGDRVSTRSRYAEEAAALESKFEAGKEELHSLEADSGRHQTALAELRAGIVQSEQSVSDLYRRRDKTRDRIEFLESVKADYSGYFGAVKTVLQSRDRFEGIHGAVAELLSVPERFEAAIETALGGAMQNIVVDTDATGRALIAELRRKNAGRATFMPMASIQSRELGASVREQVARMQGFIGIASDLVKTEEHLSKLKQNLLGTTLVVETLEQANAIGRATGGRHRIVTLEGDVVNVGGSMTGGSRKKGTPLFSQARELESLIHGLEQGEAVIREQERRIKEARQRYEETEQAQVLVSERMRTLRAEIETTRDSLAEAKRLLAITTSELSLHDTQMERLIEQEKAARMTIEETAVQIELLTKRQTELREALNRLKDAQTRGLVAIEELKRTQSEAQLEERTAVLNRDQAARELERINEALDHAVLERSHKRRDLKHVLKGFDEAEIERLKADQISYEQEEKQVAQALENLLTEIGREAETLRLMRLQEAKAEEAMKATAQQLDRQRIEHGRVSTRLETRQETLEEMGLVFELISPIGLPYEEAKEELHLLKRQLEEIGIVNLGAIEEFAEVDERFTFLSAQRDDLVAAKTDLYQIIEEMDREVIRLFKETYQSVRGHFQETFRELFGGGEADLVLADPSDLLTSGIDIIAKPPGKKLQNLSLLSGGERALTAIALLFAILKTRPVPFCVLDEVEAALDEANVARFGEFVYQLARDTQFIIITHRKGTMESADVLYGVTMQQNGISEVLSVKLEEARRTMNEESNQKEFKS